AFQGVSGLSNIGANFSTLFDRFARRSFSQDMSWFKRAGGTHNFKFGYQYGQQSNDVASLYNTGRVRIAWAAPTACCRRTSPLALRSTRPTWHSTETPEFLIAPVIRL